MHTVRYSGLGRRWGRLKTRLRDGIGIGLLVMTLSLQVLAVSALAGDFDGSVPLAGTTIKIVEINQHQIIDNVDADAVGLPKRFRIDFDTRTIRPSEDSLVRRSVRFKDPVHVENMLVIQGIDEGVEGVDDGVAWSLTISKRDGRSVLSASKNGVAYVVFGACSAAGNPK